jgi:glutamate synthase (NADPH/NADH) large chain
MLGHEVTRTWKGDGLPDDTISIDFVGSAGQSFGAFLPRGITLRLEGDANDYVGKGLSGGRVIVRPDRSARFAAEDNVIAGNVIGYGATGGRILLRGVVGERFCVRNSGATAVVEGVGDHGCEYMTGGRVVVLGPTGRNFAAGMSGGVAYVYDPDDVFGAKVNYEMVELEPLSEDDRDELRAILGVHRDETDSAVADRILSSWDVESAHFRKVMPRDYKRVLRVMDDARREGLDETATLNRVMEAARG